MEETALYLLFHKNAIKTHFIMVYNVMVFSYNINKELKLIEKLREAT